MQQQEREQTSKPIAMLVMAFLAATGNMAAAAPKPQRVDFFYNQYAPDGNGMCTASDPTARDAVGILLSWLAGKVVDSLGAWAAKAVKQYTNERQSDVEYLPFYDVTNWTTPAAGYPPGLLSCWQLRQTQCDASADPDQPCADTLPSRLTIRGVYFLDQATIKVVPVHVAITGLAAKIDKSNRNKPVSIGVSQEVTAVWRDGNRGRKEQLFSRAIFAKQFKYSDASQKILDLKTGADIAAGVASAEPLPRPPETPGLPVYIGVSFTVAEVATADPLKAWIADLFAEKRDDLRDALAAALDKL
jgi:hypothetical protein